MHDNNLHSSAMASEEMIWREHMKPGRSTSNQKKMKTPAYRQGGAGEVTAV